MIMSSMNSAETLSGAGLETLIRYVEVWTPNTDGTRLQRTAVQVIGGTGESSARRVTDVAIGEGLAGRAWHQKSPTILQEEPSELLENLSAACGTKLSAVLAIPVFRQQEIRGVVVLGCGDGLGAAEIWNRDDRDELAVTVSFYSGLPSFEFITRYTRFPKGAGVPGSVWNTGEPQLLQKPGQSKLFIRSFGNDPAEIAAIVGLPVGSSRGFPASVLLLLSSVQTPLSRAVELWDCEAMPSREDADQTTVTLRKVSGQTVSTVTEEVTAASDPGDWRTAVLQQIASTNSPALLASGDIEPVPGFTHLLAVPVYHNANLISVLSLLF